MLNPVRWIGAAFRRRRFEGAMTDEMRFHIDAFVDDLVRSGMPRAQAERQACLECGGVERAKEDCRQARGLRACDELRQDLSYTARQFRRQPGFWIVILSVLTVGIAASTDVFAIVNGVLLRPLPYREPDRLVTFVGVSYKGEFLQLRDHARTVDVGAYLPGAQVSLTGDVDPLRLTAALANAELFDVLGTSASRGRTFSAAESWPGGDPVVILSHALWTQRFGANAAVLGQRLTIDGISRTVVGVMPAAFRFPSSDTQLWLPLVINPADRIDLWASSAVIVGRLRAGIQIIQAREEVRRLAVSFRDLFPWKMPASYGSNVDVVDLTGQTVANVRPVLLAVLGAIALVLLILSVNVATLLLIRGIGRDREIAIRAALGAARSRIVRQLVVESLAVALLAGVVGIGVAFGSLRWMVSMIPADVPRLDDIQIDVRVLSFALGVSLVTGVLFGVLPAIRLSARKGDGLQWGSRGAEVGQRERRLTRILTVAELAMVVVLVICDGLALKSLWRLSQVNPGFAVDQLVSGAVSPPQFRYSQRESRRAFADTLVTRARSLPGAQAAAVAGAMPFAGAAFQSVFAVEGRLDPAQSGIWPSADVRTVITPDYPRVMGIPVLEGRAFVDADRADAPRVALISRGLARAQWGNHSPVGTRIKLPGSAPWMTIVGVVGDVNWRTLAERQSTTLYLPLAQWDVSNPRLIVRTATLRGAASNLQSVVRSLDKDTPVSDIRIGDALIEDAVARPKFIAWLFSGFAAVSLVLGAIGVYGVLAYAVNRRTREFGVRLALGATPRDVRGLVLGEGMRLTGLGVLLGLMSAIAATRVLSRILYGVGLVDGAVFATVAGALLLVGFVASYLPARKATRVNAIAALRAE